MELSITSQHGVNYYRVDGDANIEEEFKKNPCLMLKFVYLCFVLTPNVVVSEGVKEAIMRSASAFQNDLSSSSVSLRNAFDRILLIPEKPSAAFRFMAETGILYHIAPNIDELIGVTQNTHHDRDAFDHTMDVLDRTIPERVRRLTALFHDCGKRATRSEEGGRIRFIGHEIVGSHLADASIFRLGYNIKLSMRVAKLVRLHMRLKGGGNDASMVKDKHIRHLIYHAGKDFDALLDVMHADNISHTMASTLPDQIPIVRERVSKMDRDNIISFKPGITITDMLDKEGVSYQRAEQIHDRLIEKFIEHGELSMEIQRRIADNMIASRKD